MNNLRLLIMLLAASLMSDGMHAYGQITSGVVTLEELFETAERNSSQLRPAFSAQQEALKGLSEARTKRLPDINASLSLSYIGDGFITKRDFTDYMKADIPHFGNTLSLNISQPVYTGGAITTGIELAEMKLTATRYATELQRDNIRFQLTGFYLDIYKYHNLRLVVENNLSLARKVLDEMRTKHEQGMVLQNDITRYELLVSNLELQLIKIDNVIGILNNNLVTIAGLPHDTRILPDTTILARSLPVDGEALWQSEALENSPSIKLAKSTLDITRKSESLVKADRLPKIGLQAFWTIDGPILVEVPPINRNLSYWYVGVGVSYNLSSLFKTGQSLARRRAATVHASDQLEAAKENLSMSMRADYIKYLEAYEELNTQNKSVELAGRNYAIVSTRYSSDMALITDMLDAANSLLDAEQNLVNARINIIYYYYKLLFTSGKI